MRLNGSQRLKRTEMIDMFGNMKDVMDMFQRMYQQLRQNPLQMLNKQFNIPQNVNMGDPNAILQHLMNTGQVTQNQVNQVMQMKNSPIVQQLMNR